MKKIFDKTFSFLIGLIFAVGCFSFAGCNKTLPEFSVKDLTIEVGQEASFEYDLDADIFSFEIVEGADIVAKNGGKICGVKIGVAKVKHTATFSDHSQVFCESKVFVIAKTQESTDPQDPNNPQNPNGNQKPDQNSPNDDKEGTKDENDNQGEQGSNPTPQEPDKNPQNPDSNQPEENPNENQKPDENPQTPQEPDENPDNPQQEPSDPDKENTDPTPQEPDENQVLFELIGGIHFQSDSDNRILIDENATKVLLEYKLENGVKQKLRVECEEGILITLENIDNFNIIELEVSKTNFTAHLKVFYDNKLIATLEVVVP